jgi:hypothetical protein
MLYENLKGCNVGITDCVGFIKYAVEIALDGMIYTPSFIMIDSDIVILRALQQQYYWWEGFMKYAVEKVSGDMIYIRTYIYTNDS